MCTWQIVKILLNYLEMSITREFETTNTFAYDSLRNGLTSQCRGHIFTDICLLFPEVTSVKWWEQIFTGNQDADPEEPQQVRYLYSNAFNDTYSSKATHSSHWRCFLQCHSLCKYLSKTCPVCLFTYQNRISESQDTYSGLLKKWHRILYRICC